MVGPDQRYDDWEVMAAILTSPTVRDETRLCETVTPTGPAPDPSRPGSRASAGRVADFSRGLVGSRDAACAFSRDVGAQSPHTSGGDAVVIVATIPGQRNGPHMFQRIGRPGPRLLHSAHRLNACCSPPKRMLR